MAEQVWRVSADVACVHSDDGDRVAVLHLEQQVPSILVGTAASVWNALDGTRTETELIEYLAREYATDATAIHGDVMGLIRSLSSTGMITLSPRESEGVS
ncbi:Coenzyme PQQ synthesis protein D (PqqD) [Arthrobacter sp. ok909]|uniref:PqqD family protein n=1 Tax=Arthrobacter sp. ok909 TaxID=1761746 RepID=UPI000883C486|nr:PqqD family protein [Arthrobacter sp. ok909]SDP25429.1 Coenzyme PQQ synthesis protein D (PqqD) [Arthrobacter sp. ok909]